MLNLSFLSLLDGKYRSATAPLVHLHAVSFIAATCLHLRKQMLYQRLRFLSFPIRAQLSFMPTF